MLDEEAKLNEYMKQTLGTRYPHLDMHDNFRVKFRKLIAPINPFEPEQIGGANGLAFNQFKTRKSYIPDPLPNPVRFSRFLGAHYDPLNELEYKFPDPFFEATESSGTHQLFSLKAYNPPPVCTRYLDIYKRCAMINGQDKCQAEEREFLEICPNFVLNDMRNAKMQIHQVRIIQKNEYKAALIVSDYNKGRSMKDVDGTKTWEDGTSKKLRADSIWSDDRYSNVTEDEVKEARKRHAERLKREGYQPSTDIADLKPVDPVYEVYHQDKPLYKSE